MQKYLQNLSFLFVIFITSVHQLFSASSAPSDLLFNETKSTIVNTPLSLEKILIMTQSILLKVVVPVVVIGASLYIAYELLTAEGDEAKLKKAWKSVAYTSIALISIAVSYAIVSIVSRLSL